MGLHSLFGLDRYSVLTGLTENVNLTGNMFDHKDKKDLELNNDTELDEDIKKKYCINRKVGFFAIFFLAVFNFDDPEF